MYSNNVFPKIFPIWKNYMWEKSLVSLSLSKYPWKDASKVKQFMILNSLQRTTLAVFSFDFYILNLHEKNLNISVYSDISLGRTLIFKYLLSWIGNYGPYINTFFFLLWPCISIKAIISFSSGTFKSGFKFLMSFLIAQTIGCNF